MSDVIVRTRGLAKRFSLLKSERSVLRALKAALRFSTLRMFYPVLDDVNLEIRRGDRVALLGGNGMGKSTLMRLIAGILRPTAGSIEVHATSTGVFAGETGLQGELSVVDNIDLFGAIQGIPPAVVAEKRAEILATSGLDRIPYARGKELSSGQRRRLALSVFFHSDHELILLDESLSHVDAPFARISEERFEGWARRGKTFLVVSHEQDFLRRFCDRAIWIEDRQIRMTGSLDDVTVAYNRAQAERAG
jgi:ABC-type polysaccharide/polyol phosphate transport system ATPase subunit